MTVRSPPHLKVPIMVIVTSATGSKSKSTEKNRRGSCISAITLDNDELGYSSSEEELENGISSTSPESPHRQDRFSPFLHDSASSSSISEMKSFNAGPLIQPQRRGSLLLVHSSDDKTPTAETSMDTLPILPHRRAADFMLSSALRERGGPIPVNLRSVLPPLKPSRQISTDAGLLL